MLASIQVLLAFLALFTSRTIETGPDVLTDGYVEVDTEVFVSVGSLDREFFFLYRSRQNRVELLDETMALDGLGCFQIYAIPFGLREEYELAASSHYQDLRSILLRAAAKSDWYPLRFPVIEDDPTCSQKIHFRVDALQGKKLVLIEESRELFGESDQSLTEKEVRTEKRTRNSQRLLIAALGIFGLITLAGLRMRKRSQDTSRMA